MVHSRLAGAVVPELFSGRLSVVGTPDAAVAELTFSEIVCADALPNAIASKTTYRGI